MFILFEFYVILVSELSKNEMSVPFSPFPCSILQSSCTKRRGYESLPLVTSQGAATSPSDVTALNFYVRTGFIFGLSLCKHKDSGFQSQVQIHLKAPLWRDKGEETGAPLHIMKFNSHLPKNWATVYWGVVEVKKYRVLDGRLRLMKPYVKKQILGL